MQKILFLGLIIWGCHIQAQIADKNIKKWKTISNFIKKPFCNIEPYLKNDGFLLNEKEGDSQLDIYHYKNENIKFDHWALGVVNDNITVVKYNGNTEAVSFDVLPENNDLNGSVSMIERYFAFQDAILDDQFIQIGLIEDKFENTYYFQNKSRDLKIKISEIHVVGYIKGYTIYVYGSNVNLGNDESDAKSYLNKHPEKKITSRQKFEFINAQVLVDTLNHTIIKAGIGFSNPVYNFDTFGKTNLDNRSIEFFTKENKLQIRMNIPRNGVCDYGMKEIAAKYSGSGTVEYSNGKRGFYLKFKYSYSCNETTYEELFIYFYRKEEEVIEAIIKFLHLSL